MIVNFLYNLLSIIKFLFYLKKDWKYSQNDTMFQDFDGSRPYGSLEFKVEKNAIINITLPMVYGKEGCFNKIDIDRLTYYYQWSTVFFFNIFLLYYFRTVLLLAPV